MPIKKIDSQKTCYHESYRPHFSAPFFPPWCLILLFTLRTSLFWLVELDFEVEALREDSLHFLAIYSWCFSLASYIPLAKSLAYTAASSSFLLVQCFFKAIHWHLCWRTCGVTKCWILDPLVLGFLLSCLGAFSQHANRHHFIQRDQKVCRFCELFWAPR